MIANRRNQANTAIKYFFIGSLPQVQLLKDRQQTSKQIQR